MTLIRFAVLTIALTSPLLQAQDPAAPAPEATPAPAAPAAVAAAPAPAPEPPLKSLVGFNGLINTGNSESTSLGGNSVTTYRWEKNKVEGNGAIAYGRAKDPATGNTTTNTNNWKVLGRYDRFLTDPLSAFGLGHVGQDEPAGFDWRYGGATGLAHEIWKTDPNYFKYEAGYDFTHEQRVKAPDADIHSGRLFFRYARKISAWATVGQDLETLINVEDGNDTRLNSLTSLTVALTTKLGFQAGFEVRFDNEPVPGFEKTDTKTVLGLTINVL